jgi:hypothetical protein
MPKRLEEELELSVTVAVTVIGFPPVNDEELDEIVVVVLSGVVLVLVELDDVDNCTVPVLGAWVPSPEYSADIVTVLGEFMAAVYEVEHVPDEMLQDSGVNEPPP